MQSNGNVVGSKTRNSYLLNFQQGNNTWRQYAPRWSNSQYYTCNPNSYSGIDAKLTRGAIVNQTSTNQKLLTLSTSGSIYQVGTQAFTVEIPAQQDGGTPNEVNGVVVSDNVKYSFNLGSIMVNSNLINCAESSDSTIESNAAFNDALKSKTFLLNENDTLVVGRTAYYWNGDINLLFHDYIYRVKLMNNSTGTMHRLLAQDTIHLGDTINVEYLDGFIIRNIANNSDSFYVQMQVDSVGLIQKYVLNTIFGDGNPLPHHRTRNSNAGNLPKDFKLYQNYPNPFNPVTKINFDLPRSSKVNIRIYDAAGKLVTTLLDDYRQAGTHNVIFNASNLASGIYFYRFESSGFVDSKKMVVLK